MKEKTGEKNRMKNTDQTLKTSTLEKREKREDDSTFFYNIENLAPDGLSLARAHTRAHTRYLQISSLRSLVGVSL